MTHEYPDPHLQIQRLTYENFMLKHQNRLLRETIARLASTTEMAGNGEIETMTGPAAGELRARIGYAADAINIQPVA